MLIANVILSIQMPYMMIIMFCFIVLPIETLTLYFAQRPILKAAPALGLVALANVISWIGGIVITSLVPVPRGFMMHESRPEYFQGIVIGFVLAFFLSWLIEHRVLRFFSSRYNFKHLSRTMFMANFTSYLAVFAAMMGRY